jgi:hypothetical protein
MWAAMLLTGLCAAIASTDPAPAVYAQILADSSGRRGIKYVTSTDPIPSAGLGVAYGTYGDSINATGWATLQVQTNNSYSDTLQAYAAGYLEGAVSQTREYWHLLNMCLSKPFSKELEGYLTLQWEWMRENARTNAHNDSFWYNVGLALDQQEGMFDGYNDAAPASEQLSWMQFYCGTLDGDLYDLRVVFPDNPENPTRNIGDGHCSVLIKPIGDTNAPTDLYIGHTNWAGFESMTRIYKSFDLPFAIGGGVNTTVPGRYIAFASYPATLPR